MSAHAQGRLQSFLAPPDRVCLALPGSGSGPAKVKDQRGPAAAQGNHQARVAEGETGGDGGRGSDLVPVRLAAMAGPGKPERTGGYPGSTPCFQPGWPAGENRPRPPPGS